MQLTKRQLSYLAWTALALSPLTALETQAQYQLTPFRPSGDVGFPVAIDNGGTILAGGFFGEPALLNGDSVTPISIPNSLFPSLGGMNSKGTIVGSAFAADRSGRFGFALTKRGEITLLNIPGFATSPLGINNRGVVVGSASGEDRIQHGFVWDSTGPRLFTAPGAHYTRIVGINESGTAVGDYVIVGEDSYESRAFTLEGSKFIPLNIPGALSSDAGGINSRGEIVGSYTAQTNLDRGFIYDRGVVTSVDYPLDAPASLPPEPFDWGDLGSGTITFVRDGSSFTSITGINDRGDIIGQAEAGYLPVVECGGCGLTADDFFPLGLVDAFTGERDGSRTVHVKSAGKPKKMLLPRGTTARDIIRGRRP